MFEQLFSASDGLAATHSHTNVFGPLGVGNVGMPEMFEVMLHVVWMTA